MQRKGGTGVKKEKRTAGEGAQGLFSSISELGHQSLHKPVTFCLPQPLLPLPPRPTARPAFPCVQHPA